MTHTAHPVPLQAPRGPVARLAASRPITFLLTVVFTLEAAIMAWPVSAHFGVLPGGELPIPIFAMATTVFVMFPTALWVTRILDGPGARREYWSRILRWQVRPTWWLFALVAAPLSTLAIGVVMGGQLELTHLTDVLKHQALEIVIALLVINLWEEAVWVGFVQRVLERRHNIAVAAALTAIPFTAVHLPLELVSPDASVLRVVWGMSELLGFSVVLRLFMAMAFRGTGKSILLVGLLHATFNASNNPGGVADQLLAHVNQNYAAVVAVTLLTATLSGISWARHRARQRGRLTRPAREASRRRTRSWIGDGRDHR